MCDITEVGQAEAGGHRREAILGAISWAAERFLRVTSFSEERVQEMLSQLGQATETSRIYVFENHLGEDGTHLTSQRYEWVAPGITSQMNNPDLQDFPWQAGGMGRWETTLRQGKVIQGHVRELPAVEQRILGPQEIRSIVVVPIVIGQKWWGFIGFDECRVEREWSATEIDALKTAGAILGAMIERRRGEQELSEYRERLEDLVQERTAELARANERLRREIAERKLAEAALTESREKYHNLYKLMRRITDNVPDLMWAKDMDDKYLFANQAIADKLLMCGSPDNAIGRTDIYFARQERNAGYEHTFGEVCLDSDKIIKKQRKPGRFLEDGLVRGQYLVLDVHKAPFRDENGKIIGTVGCGRDVTREKKTEQALSHSEERHRSLVENTMDGYFILEPSSNKFIFSNQRFCDLFGYDREEVLGMSVEDVISSDDHATLAERINARLKGEKLFPERQIYTVKRKDGSTFRAEISSSSVTFQGGKVIQGTLRDVTEHECLQQQLRQAQKMEAIGTLAGGIAHDFNNLLMGIQGNASLMLLETDPGHPHYEKLKYIEEYVQSGAKLTGQLLGFARGGKYQVKPTDVNKLIQKTSEMFGRTRKEIRIHRKYQENLWTAKADPGQIEQALLNLYVNAWHAMPAGGDLYIATKNFTLDEHVVKPYAVKPGRYVKLSVTDTGLGMDKETLKRIFDPFFTTRKMGRGTGLGLASVYGIIKNHGGMIDVGSEKGEGTTFCVYLPASEKETAREQTAKRELLKGKETVLLVDDEEMVIDVARQMLESMGYRVFIAKNGQEAIDVYSKNRKIIDVVVLDMIMPDMGGAKIHERMKTIDPSVKTLVSSGYSLNLQATGMLERGCNGFIQKPFDMKELSQKLREVLDTEPTPR